MSQPVSAAPHRIALLLSMVLVLAGGLRAQNSPGVARISLIDGEVSMLRQGDTTWTSAALNTPLVSGDEVYVANAGRLELELDANDALRLAGDTDLRISRFFGTDLQLQLRTGTLSFTASDRNFLPAEIETPNMSVRPLSAGVLRVDVVDATHTSVTVWHGRAEVFASNGRAVVEEGQQIQIQGATDNAEYQVVAAPELDTWDQWVQQREDRVRNARSYRYMNRDIYGGEDLDAYGRWVTVPNYGECWQPTYFVSDWSPYYYGRWLWTPYYGWSWVSYEPWGWAPYHFGRWFWAPRWGWVWWPGFRHRRPIWAPAFVSFFFGSGAFVQGLGFGPGVVAWVPLAPFEPFFGFSRVRTITQVNNITIINNIIVDRGARFGRLPIPVAHLRNASAPGGLIAISSEEFANGRVDQGGRALSPVHLSGFHPIHGTPPVVPTARSLQPLPGRISTPAPANLAGLPVFHRGPITRKPAALPLTLPQVTRAMVGARRAAGLPTLDITRPQRVPPAPGRSAFMRSPTMPAPPMATGGAIRIERPTRGPVLLTNEGPQRTPAMVTPPVRTTPLPRPAAGMRSTQPGWHTFGRPGTVRPMPMPTPQRAPTPAPAIVPAPPSTRRPAVPPAASSFRRFSESGPVGSVQGVLRGAMGGIAPVRTPPEPPSATIPNQFQNHPLGTVVMPVIINRDGNREANPDIHRNQNMGNWAGHAGSLPMTSRSTPMMTRRDPQPGRNPSTPTAPVMRQPATPSTTPRATIHSSPRPASAPRTTMPAPASRMSHTLGRG